MKPVIIVAAALLLAGCADQRAVYDTSIRETAVYSAANVKPLEPLRYPVKAARLTTYTAWADGQDGKSVTAARDMWITVEPELQQACRAFPPGEVVPKLNQLLGLQPAVAGDTPPKIILMTIESEQPVGPTGKGIFRPCADPDPTATSCGNTLAGSDAYVRWFTTTALGNYRIDPEIKQTGYPWTRLGYTWNWDPASPDHRGPQEYVVPAGTKLTVRKVVTPEEYCAGR